MMLRENEEVLENTWHQLRQKEKECDELEDKCLALWLDNDSICYKTLCQGLLSLLGQQEISRHRRKTQLS